MNFALDYNKVMNSMDVDKTKIAKVICDTNNFSNITNLNDIYLSNL